MSTYGLKRKKFTSGAQQQSHLENANRVAVTSPASDGRLHQPGSYPTLGNDPESGTRPISNPDSGRSPIVEPQKNLSSPLDPWYPHVFMGLDTPSVSSAPGTRPPPAKAVGRVAPSTISN